MKVKPRKFDEVNLYRHPDYALPPLEETAVVKREPNQTPVKMNGILRTRTDHLSESIGGEFDDEFDGNLFDGVELSGQQRSENSFAAVNAGDEVPKTIEAAKPVTASSGVASTRSTPAVNSDPQRAFNPQGQTTPASRVHNGGPGQPPQQNQPNLAPGRPQVIPPIARGPQTPVQQQPIARPDQARPRMPPPTVDIHVPPKAPISNIQTPQNQPLRPSPPQPNQAPTATSNPQGRPTGFVTSRAAELVQNTESVTSNYIPAFNPHVDSPVPKEQRTPGIDHTSSRPIKRQEIGAPPQPVPPGPPANSTTNNGGAFNRPGPGFGRAGNSNFVNPQQDMNRRIGMPAGGGAAMSPTPNRNAYKPPMKRPPLQDVSNARGGTGHTGEPEAKRQRVEGPGGTVGLENKAPVEGT
jgi:hypothetical protein